MASPLNTPSRHKDLLTHPSGGGFGQRECHVAQQAEGSRPPPVGRGRSPTPAPQGGSQGRQASGAGIHPGAARLSAPGYANRHLPLLPGPRGPGGWAPRAGCELGSAVWREEAQGWGRAAEAGAHGHPPLSRAVVEAAATPMCSWPPSKGKLSLLLTALLTSYLPSCPAHSRRPVNAGGVAGLLSAPGTA